MKKEVRMKAQVAAALVALIVMACANASPTAPAVTPALAEQGGGASATARVADKWCIVSGEGTDLLHVWGPFRTEDEAVKWGQEARVTGRIVGITEPGVRRAAVALKPGGTGLWAIEAGVDGSSEPVALGSWMTYADASLYADTNLPAGTWLVVPYRQVGPGKLR